MKMVERGVFANKLKEIVAYPAEGDLRNDFIQQNSEIITLTPHTNLEQTSGAKRNDGLNKEINDPLRVQHVVRVNLLLRGEEPAFVDRFIIKKSTTPNAGMGVFAAAPIGEGEDIGIYAGQHRSSPHFRSEYYMYSEEYGYGLDASAPSGKDAPIFHGLHLANDPHLPLVLGSGPKWREYRSKRNANEYNMEAQPNFVLRALRNIAEGEELCYHYRWEETDYQDSEEDDNSMPYKDDEDYD
jgi:hypothetical protein